MCIAYQSGKDALRTGDSKVISSMSKEQLQANLPDGWTYTEQLKSLLTPTFMI